MLPKHPALMVESVDTRDLKSLGPKGRAGSTPAWGTWLQSYCKVAAMPGNLFVSLFIRKEFQHFLICKQLYLIT